MKRHITTGLFVFALWAGVGTCQALAQSQTFMLVPGIPGGSVDANHRGWIDITSLTQTLDAAAKPCPQCSVMVVKPLDIAGPLLWAAAVSGQTFTEVQIEVVNAVGVRYYVLKLETATVSSISTVSDTTFPGESVALHAASLILTFTPLKPDGTPGTPVTSTFSC